MSNYSQNSDSVIFYSGIKGVSTSLRWLMIPQHAVENIGLWVWCYKNGYPVGLEFQKAASDFKAYQQKLVDFDLQLDSRRSRAESVSMSTSDLIQAIDDIELERQNFPAPPVYSGEYDFTDYREIPLLSRRLPKRAGRYTVIVDEVQRIFPTRNGAKAVPDSLVYLQTARHDAVDFVFITQSLTLIDSSLQALVSTFIHLDRRFGFNGAWVYESSTAIPVYPGKDINKTFFKYDKRNYSLYRSAESHASSFKIPRLVYYVVLAAVFLACLLYYFYTKRFHHDDPPKPVPSVNSLSLPDSSGISGQQDKKIDWIRDSIPTVRGLPYTAPIYAELAKPVTFPVVSGCVASPKKCTCYTQQATKIDMPPDLCRAMVAQASFNVFKHDQYSSQEQIASK